jgi:nitrogen fixation NifU-like protein
MPLLIIGGQGMSGLSNILMEHFATPRNQGPMEDPDLIGLVGTPGNGPFLLLCVRLKDSCVVEAKFQTYGCGASIAAGSVLTEMIRGRSVKECLALTTEELTAALGGVPPNKLHCPALAIGALKNALREFEAGE